MDLVCIDLEGVLVPEIWEGVAARAGIDELRLTTRDIPDYDALMTHRLKIAAANGLKLGDIVSVVEDLDPLDGAAEFLAWARQHYQVAIVSDTFYEFATPLLRRLDWPMLLCNRLEVAADGEITGYRLRQKHQKRTAVKAFQQLQYTVLATGDSYNDTGMLGQADAGILFRPPDEIAEAFPQFPVARSYDALREHFLAASERLAREKENIASP